METTKKLKVRVTEKETKEGRKFNTYKTFSKNGRATELKFRKEVKLLPEKDCYIVVKASDINLNTSGEYPVCWIQDVQAIEDIAPAQAEKNLEKVNDYFG